MKIFSSNLKICITARVWSMEISKNTYKLSASFYEQIFKKTPSHLLANSWSEFLPTDPDVQGLIPDATRLSEK
jgi:hypothetical protein